MKLQRFTYCAVLIGAFAFGQQQPAGKPAAGKPAAAKKDIDPEALRVLKAALDPIHAASSFSFKARVSKEHLGTNGQLITLFNISEVTVKRPDKMHINFKGRGKEVEVFHSNETVVLYTPAAKVYTTVKVPPTLDATLAALEKKGIFLPIRNFLESDPYKSLTDDLQTAYIVGRVNIFDEPVHQLAFTEPHAEWQLWVTGGDKPRVVRLQVIDKTEAFQPRTVVQFMDWDFDATPNDGAFTFTKPADAKEVPLGTETARKNK